MQLTRIYYPFTTAPGARLDVTVTKGDPVQYGTTALPFQADGELKVGDTVTFDRTFVLNVSGQSEVDVGPVTPPPLPPPSVPEGYGPDWRPPSEAELRQGGVTAIEGKERPE